MPVSRARLTAALGTLATAVAGGVATDPDSRWFRRLDKPGWFPPPATFGVVWTGLYTGIGLAAGEVLHHGNTGRPGFARALGVNLAPYAAWTAFATALSTAIARRNR